MVGGPVPEATQGDLLEEVGNCAAPVFRYLERLAAHGEVIYQDDTAVRVVALMEENRQPEAPARTGRYTTGLIAAVEGRRMCLYYAGRQHAGENRAALLSKREPQRGKPLVMSAAVASNAADEQTLIRCHCLAHGQRKFRDLDEVFPGESAGVTQGWRQVFAQEEKAREQPWSAEERLAYPQTYSGPLLDGLKEGLEQQGTERTVEPNSSLGQAIAYLLKHWVPLTRFLTVPGAPRDNNGAERARKLGIRQRKNSRCYATEQSASIASLLTRVIAPCVPAGGNAVAYRGAVQTHRHAVFADPAAWLPWPYPAALGPP